MKVVAINGSPRPEGNTYLTIKAFVEALEKESVETQILQAGSAGISGCSHCGGCVNIGRCQKSDEQFKAWSEILFDADGIFLAAPVYFGSMPGPIKSFLDRFFFQCLRSGIMYHKVGASMAILRRAGGLTTLDDLNRYFFSSGMIIVTATGSNLIHGAKPGEILQDTEGMDAVMKLARNMTWIIKMKEATKDLLPPPPFTKKPMMNFIR